MIEAVFFDNDGTLMDSEPIHGEAILATLAEHNIHRSVLWFEQFIGVDDATMWARIHKNEGLTCDIKTLRKSKSAHFLAVLERDGVPVLPGVHSSIKAVREAKLPIAVVSSTSYETLEHLHKAAKLTGMFDYIVSGTDCNVARHKPSPDVYKYAAKLVGVNPENTIAIEDSTSGATSAFEAGCKTFVLGDCEVPSGVCRIESLEEILWTSLLR